MLWKYQNESGAVMVIREETQQSLLEREGFKLVSEVEYDAKGKLVEVTAQPE